MAAILAFKSENESNPFIIFLSDVICLEENKDKTITYWFVTGTSKELYSQKSLSTFEDCGNCIKNFISNFSGNISEIKTFDNRTVYLHNDYLKANATGDISLLSGEILSDAQTKPALP